LYKPFIIIEMYYITFITQHVLDPCTTNDLRNKNNFCFVEFSE
jgi:hypothetical protein